MSLFSLSEQKAETFHQAVLGLVGAHPNLITRAHAALATLRTDNPDQATLWDRWSEALDLPVPEMANVVLDKSADGGLLRAHSPFTAALSNAERNAIWQRIGLVQFMGYYYSAATDLALDLTEQAAITGIDVESLTTWQTQAPLEIAKETLSTLKQIVALHKTLTGIAPDPEIRKRWLRCDSETLSATPLDLLMDGKMEDVLDSLVGAAQITLGPDDMPRMG